MVSADADTLGATSSRMLWVDVVRGGAVFLVILYHVVIGLKVAGVSPPLWAVRLDAAAAPFRMPMLMFCSGLLLAKALRKPPRVYVAGKLRRIGWPYLIWTLVLVTFLMVGSQIAGEGSFTPKRVWGYLISPDTYTWYLSYLLAFYLIALFLPEPVRAWLIPTLLVICGIAHDGDGWSRVTFLLAFFLLGDYAMRHRRRWPAILRSRLILVVSLAVAVTTILVAVEVGGQRYAVWSAVGIVAALVVAIPITSWAAERWLGRPFVAIGRDSLVYYVTHWVVVTAGVHVAGILGVRNGSVLVVGLVLVAVLVCAVMVLLTRRVPIINALYVWPFRGSPRQPVVITTKSERPLTS